MSEKSANPAPLGLLGFGMTTVLLSFVHNARLGPVDSMILAMGIAYGGLAQVIAGIMEYKKGNTFGTVAFTSYGLFWWSYVILNLLPKYYLLVQTQAAKNEALMMYYFMWGPLHLRHVLRRYEKESRLTIRFHEPCNTVLSTCR